MKTRVLGGALAMLLALAAGAITPAAAGGPPVSDPYNDTYQSEGLTVGGNYTPLLGLGACGEGSDSSLWVLWYAPGSAQDYFWVERGNATELILTPPFDHESTPISVNGTYVPLVGDWDGDGCDDIFWYAPGAAQDYVWWGAADGSFTSKPLSVNGTYEPFVGIFSDVEGDEAGRDDIFWYSPGAGAEFIWDGQSDRSFDSYAAPSVNGTYRPGAFIASLGEPVSTILWHAPGSAQDYLWTGMIAGESAPDTSTAVSVNGDYQPLAGYGALLLYAPGPAPDFAISGFDTDTGELTTVTAKINGTYTPAIRSVIGSLYLFLWHAPGPAGDYLWRIDVSG